MYIKYRTTGCADPAHEPTKGERMVSAMWSLLDYVLIVGCTQATDFHIVWVLFVPQREKEPT